jgi:hypothetical protein
VDRFINATANKIVDFLATHVEATVKEAKIFGRGLAKGLARDEVRRAASCAEAAAVGWQETTPIRAIPDGGIAASALYTVTACAVAAAAD